MIKQAILLAAGTGNRLFPHTKDRPKCMVSVNGATIVDTLLDALHPMGIEEMIVVTGYQAQVLEDHLRTRSDFNWHFIHNQQYATTNNILSLYAAREAISAPFLILESDIYVKPETLRGLDKADQISVSAYRPGMTGTGVELDSTGAVKTMTIGAHLVCPEMLGSMHKTVNFYSFSEDTWKCYRQALERWIQAERLDRYYEEVLAELINRGDVRMHAIDVGTTGWGEVDTPDDLAALEAGLATSNR